MLFMEIIYFCSQKNLTKTSEEKLEWQISVE